MLFWFVSINGLFSLPLLASPVNTTIPLVYGFVLSFLPPFSLAVLQSWFQTSRTLFCLRSLDETKDARYIEN
uniref:Secreted protein n=1 Tax=Anopheles darlingi TaxID=43151 RepID=A0A2M4D7Y2_ANODA